jgi:hypothetical protein
VGSVLFYHSHTCDQPGARLCLWFHQFHHLLSYSKCMCQHVLQLFVFTKNLPLPGHYAFFCCLCVTACVKVGTFKSWWVMKMSIIQLVVIMDSGWHSRVGRVGPVQLSMSTCSPWFWFYGGCPHLSYVCLFYITSCWFIHFDQAVSFSVLEAVVWLIYIWFVYILSSWTWFL